jgi:H3 lysine-79-specific histone-lysine N-methyltransferase
MGDIELERANMLESARVNELMARADVVFVNNKVFGEKVYVLFSFVLGS